MSYWLLLTAAQRVVNNIADFQEVQVWLDGSLIGRLNPGVSFVPYSVFLGSPGAGVHTLKIQGGSIANDTALLANAQITAVTSASSVPAIVGSQPAFGSGFSQAFTFQFFNPAGWRDLSVVNILVNSALDGRRACYLAYVVSTNTLVLVDDNGDAGGPYAGTVTLGDATVIQNGQCAVSLVSAVGNGVTLALTLNITFKPAFAGNKILFLAGRDRVGANNTDWQATGTWSVL